MKTTLFITLILLIISFLTHLYTTHANCSLVGTWNASYTSYYNSITFLANGTAYGCITNPPQTTDNQRYATPCLYNGSWSLDSIDGYVIIVNFLPNKYNSIILLSNRLFNYSLNFDGGCQIHKSKNVTVNYIDDMFCITDAPATHASTQSFFNAGCFITFIGTSCSQFYFSDLNGRISQIIESGTIFQNYTLVQTAPPSPSVPEPSTAPFCSVRGRTFVYPIPGRTFEYITGPAVNTTYSISYDDTESSLYNATVVYTNPDNSSANCNVTWQGTFSVQAAQGTSLSIRTMKTNLFCRINRSTNLIGISIYH